MNRKVVVLLSAMAGFIQACDSSDSGVRLLEDERPAASRPTSSLQIDVFSNNIAAARNLPDASSSSSLNLYDNAGFENGIDGWTACLPGAIDTSAEAYSGANALNLRGGNCFYRSVQASAGDSYSLSCHIKLTSDQAWTGMGMTFSNDSFDSLLQAPVAVVTSGEYVRTDTVATAPEGTSFISMWIHSDHGALVDDCSLTLESNQDPAEPLNEINLLANGDFATPGENDGAAYWTRGCSGSVVADGSSLFVADGACADQALSVGALNNIATSDATFSCLVTEVAGYSDLSIFLDNELQTHTRISPEDKNTRVALSTDAKKAGNGFVSLYSDGHLKVEDCRLTSADGGINTPTDTDSTTDTTIVSTTDNNTDTAIDSSTDTATDTDTATGDTTDTATDNGTATDSSTDAGTDTPITDNSETSARYRLTFNATWSAQNHPTNFPPPAHFSPLAGAVHNDQIALWATGQPASPGIKLMAETGDASILLDEVESAIANGTAATTVFGGGVPVSPGTVSVEFEVTRDHPLVTITSMVAPSPDWFVGIRDVALFDGTRFVDSLTLDLPVYDSGTDSGERFTSGDQATQPPAAIARLTSDSADSDFVNGLPGLGQFVITKLP